MDDEEKSYVKIMLRKRHREDENAIEQIFTEQYCKLLDTIVRENFVELCYKCNGLQTDYHMCDGKSATYVKQLGSRIMDESTAKQRTDTWLQFLDEVTKRGILKKVILYWLKDFTSVANKIDSNILKFHEFMSDEYSADLKEIFIYKVE